MPGVFGGGGGSTQTVKQNADPWEGAQPGMREGIRDLTQIYRWGTSSTPNHVPDYYPGSTVAPMSGYTQDAINAQADRARQGSAVVNAAQNDLTKTLQGGYLKGESPFLQRAINYATQPMINAYENTVAPGLDSTFSAAGRYGSNSHFNVQDDAADTLQRNIGGVAGQMAYQNYADERNRMIQAGALAPTLANQDYLDINQLGAAGSAMDAYNQALVNSDIDRWNYNQDAEWNRTKDFLGALSGKTQWGGTTTQKGGAPNPFTSAIGGASTGAGLAGLLGATAGSTGSWLGAGIGAGLGLLSDARLKTDVEPVGMLNNGLPLYSYRYTFDPDGPTHIGVMAQEAAQVKPDAVGVTPEGFLMVDYERVSE